MDFGSQVLKNRGPDEQIQLSVASAHFELGNYETAAEGFSDSEALTSDHLRDYAVCLGRMGKLQEAEAVLSDLTASGVSSEATLYVRGEVSLAQEKWLEAEEFFLSVLDKTSTPAMIRRCCISLGDLYRNCAALVRINASPIPHPATKSVQILSAAVSQEALRYEQIQHDICNPILCDRLFKSFIRMTSLCFSVQLADRTRIITKGVFISASSP